MMLEYKSYQMRKCMISHHGPGGRKPLTLTTQVRCCRGGGGKDIRDASTGLGTFVDVVQVETLRLPASYFLDS